MNQIPDTFLPGSRSWLARAAGGCGPQYLRLRAGMGRAGEGARGRQGEHLRRDHRAAGPASHRGAPEPDRAGALGRSGRVHRRRARDRLAAAGADAVGQLRRSRRDSPAISRRRASRELLEIPQLRRPRAGRRARRRQSARPPRSAQHRESRARRSPSAWRSSIRGEAAYYQARAQGFLERWRQAIARWEKAGAPLKGMAIVVYHKNMSYLIDWLGLREVGALEPKPGLPPTASHLSELLARLARESGEGGGTFGLQRSAGGGMAVGARENSGRHAALHGRRHRQGARTCSACSTTRWRGCSRWRNDASRRSTWASCGRRSSPACWSPPRTCRSASRSSTAASCSSISRSRRSRDWA